MAKKRIYEQVDVTATAGDESTSLVFTSTTEEPRSLQRVCLDITTANVDLLVMDERETIVDVPLDVKPLADKWLDIEREIAIGNQVKLGIRNGTGGAVTAKICYESLVGK